MDLILEGEDEDIIEGADALIGQVIDDRYELQRVLAVGAAGAVFEARHVALGRRLALKLMRRQADVATDRDVRRRVRVEAETLARLAHPNIVAVFDVGLWRGQSFFVMELLDGLTLSGLMRHIGPIPLKRLLPLARQICRALDATHSAGVIHRDLKPSNVMIVRADGEDVVKLVDFGVAKDLRAVTRHTLQGAMLGTPKYMAPEQIVDDAGPVGPAADLYALGAILYRAVIGRGVFPGLRGVQQLVAHVRQEPPGFDVARPGHGLPGRFERAVLRCLAKRPEDRFPSAMALDAELAAIEDELGGARRGGAAPGRAVVP
ncbi:MAG TPA: serine/threonine-protein kinase, partial [Myxococcota bacterium]|nr:serine/threonine-protein kinase [Myxococcota bacterium]